MSGPADVPIRRWANFTPGPPYQRLLQVVMYVAGGLFFFYDKIDIADFTAFILYIGIFLNPVRRIISFVEQYQNGMTGLWRFCEIMDTSPEADTQGGRH